LPWRWPRFGSWPELQHRTSQDGGRPRQGRGEGPEGHTGAAWGGRFDSRKGRTKRTGAGGESTEAAARFERSLQGGCYAQTSCCALSWRSVAGVGAVDRPPRSERQAPSSSRFSSAPAREIYLLVALRVLATTKRTTKTSASTSAPALESGTCFKAKFLGPPRPLQSRGPQ
jgi:hypothetical protein